MQARTQRPTGKPAVLGPSRQHLHLLTHVIGLTKPESARETARESERARGLRAEQNEGGGTRERREEEEGGEGRGGARERREEEEGGEGRGEARGGARMPGCTHAMLHRTKAFHSTN